MLVDGRIATCCTDDILTLYFFSSLDSCIFTFSTFQHHHQLVFRIAILPCSFFSGTPLCLCFQVCYQM